MRESSADTDIVLRLGRSRRVSAVEEFAEIELISTHFAPVE